MVRVPFFSMNRPTGIIGLSLVIVSLTWIIFSILYVLNGFGWDGSKLVKTVWIVFGFVLLALSMIILVSGAILTFANHRTWRKEMEGDDEGLPPESVTYFDLNRVEGFLAVLMLPLSTVFLINGIVYYIVYKAIWDPKNIDAKRLAMGFKGGATWFFVIMVGLWIAAGICLFINKYYVMLEEDMPSKKKEKPKKDKPEKKKEDKKKEEEKKKPLPPPPED